MKTRILSAFTTLVMFITMLLTPQLLTGVSAADGVSLPFKDVRSKQWFYGAVQKMYTSGLMEGKSKDKFDPIGTDQKGPAAIYWDDGMAYQSAYGNLSLMLADTDSQSAAASARLWSTT